MAHYNPQTNRAAAPAAYNPEACPCPLGLFGTPRMFARTQTSKLQDTLEYRKHNSNMHVNVRKLQI